MPKKHGSKPAMAETPNEELGRQFLSDERIQCVNGHWSVWADTHWRLVDGRDIRDLVMNWADQRFSNLNLHLVNFVLQFGRSKTKQNSDIPTFWLGKPPNRLSHLEPETIKPTSFGFLDLSEGKLHKPHQTLYATDAVQIQSEQKPDCPMWLKFLGETFGNDSQSIDTVQEFFGQCLTSDNSFAKMMVFVGESRAGKGVLANVMQRVIGNACSFNLAGLSKDFALQEMVHCTLAVDGDQRGFVNQGAVDQLLKIVGRDLVAVNRKHQTIVSMRLPTKLLVVSNQILNTKEASDALINRLLVIEFPNGRIKNGLPIDVDLEDRLIRKEHWGILLWAIEGWNRLRKRGQYIQPDSAKHLIQEIQESSQPVKQFVEDKCFLKRGAYCLKHELLQAYDCWRYTRNLPRCSMKTLTRELYAAFGNSIKANRKLVDGKRYNVFFGLEFLPQNKQDNGADLPASGRLNGRMPGQENKQFGWEKR